METVEVIPSWLINSLVGVLALVFLLVWTIWRTMENRKTVKGKVLVELWLKKGVVVEEFYDVDVQEITVESSGSVNKYYIREDSIYHELYPKKTKFPWTQVTVQKAAFVEGNPEPIVKRNAEPIATAKLIGGLRDEEFSQFALQASKTMNELKDRYLKPSTVYFILIVVGLASVLSGVFSFLTYNMISDLTEALNKITAGLGL